MGIWLCGCMGSCDNGFALLREQDPDVSVGVRACVCVGVGVVVGVWLCVWMHAYVDVAV